VSRPLRAAELRSLLLLADVALATPDPSAAIVSGARAARWRGRLEAAAAALARGLAAGDPPSRCVEDAAPRHVIASLRSGEVSGDAAEGVRRALRASERSGDAGEAARRVAAWPLLLFALTTFTCGAVSAHLLPVQADWLREFVVAGAGMKPAQRAVFWLAQHSQLLLIAGGLAAAAPLLLCGLAGLLEPAPRASRVLVGLPLLGPLLRWRAAAARLDVFAGSLRAGLAPPEAHALAAASIGTACLRRDAEAATRRLREGIALRDALSDSGLPRSIAAALATQGWDDGDGLSTVAQDAGEGAAALERRLAAFVAGGALLGTAAVLFLTIWLSTIAILGSFGVA
jgi:type II secretory pathway component PulF